MATEKAATTRLDTRQLQALFGVTHMSIYHWRKGTPTRAPLKTLKPAKDEPAKAVRFDANATLAWAKKHGVEPITTLDKVLSGKANVAKKSGPKPRAASA